MLSNGSLLYSWMFGKHWILVFIWPQTCASEVWTQQKAGSESLLALRVLAAPTIPLTGEPPHTRIPPDEKRANKHQRPWRAQSEPMKSSLLSRYTNMKGSMSTERESRHRVQESWTKALKKKSVLSSLSTTGTSWETFREIRLTSHAYILLISFVC